LEDSFAGVQAGHGAGAYVIMVPDVLQPTPGIREQADQVLESLLGVVHLIKAGQLTFSS